MHLCVSLPLSIFLSTHLAGLSSLSICPRLVLASCVWRPVFNPALSKLELDVGLAVLLNAFYLLLELLQERHDARTCEPVSDLKCCILVGLQKNDVSIFGQIQIPLYVIDLL